MGAICDCCAEPDGRQAIIVEEVEEIESVEGGCPRPIPLNLLPPSLARRVSVFDVNLALNHTNPTRQRGRPVPNSTVLGPRRLAGTWTAQLRICTPSPHGLTSPSRLPQHYSTI